MRLDPTKDREFVSAEQWNETDLTMLLFEERPEGDKKKGFLANSFSGNERNRLFLQANGNFEEASLVSGADFREDGRGFVLFDYDHDGFVDMGVISTQRPRFRILRNAMSDGEQATANRSVFVNLVGGNDTAEPSDQWSARDAYGATLLVTTGDTKRMYQNSCGEGLSSQNSKWIHIGVGAMETIDRIDVTWPSGKKTVHENIKAGERVTFYEKGDVAG